MTMNMTDDDANGSSSDLAGELSGRHPVSIGHLVMGVAFLGLVLVWGLVTSSAVEGADIRFLLPVPWVAGGLAGLAALLTRDRRRRSRGVTGWSGDDPARSPSQAPSTMEE